MLMKLKLTAIAAGLSALCAQSGSAQELQRVNRWLDVGITNVGAGPNRDTVRVDTYTIDAESDGVRVWTKMVAHGAGTEGYEAYNLWLINCNDRSHRRLVLYDLDPTGQLISYNPEGQPATAGPVPDMVTSTCAYVQAMDSVRHAIHSGTR